MFSLVSRKFLAMRNITLYSVCEQIENPYLLTVLLSLTLNELPWAAGTTVEGVLEAFSFPGYNIFSTSTL